MVALSESEQSAVRCLLSRVKRAESIPLSTTMLDNYLIFTNGACESEGEKTGSVVVFLWA